MKPVSGSIPYPSYECPAGTLVTARSHLIDRFTADCEIIHLPPREVLGNTLNYEMQQGVTRTKMMNEKRFVGPWKPKIRDLEGTCIIEFRRQSPANWAHLLNDHMPNYFAACDEAGVSPDDCTILLPKVTPKHIKEAMDFFGLTYECTNDDIRGEIFHIDKLGGNRAIRQDWVNLPLLRDRIATSRATEIVPDNLPAKVFLSRRETGWSKTKPRFLRCWSLKASCGFTQKSYR